MILAPTKQDVSAFRLNKVVGSNCRTVQSSLSLSSKSQWICPNTSACGGGTKADGPRNNALACFLPKRQGSRHRSCKSNFLQQQKLSRERRLYASGARSCAQMAFSILHGALLPFGKKRTATSLTGGSRRVLTRLSGVALAYGR